MIFSSDANFFYLNVIFHRMFEVEEIFIKRVYNLSHKKYS